jgi:hypothetical protein
VKPKKRVRGPKKAAVSQELLTKDAASSSGFVEGGASSMQSIQSLKTTGQTQDKIHGSCRLCILEALQVFDVKRCRPAVIKALAHDEWRPGTTRQWKSVWKSSFKPSDLQNPTALMTTMTSDMKHDIILMYQTLFSQSAKWSPKRLELPEQAADDYNRRVLLLKRLFLCFAVCKLTYCIEENGAATHAWPFPLASALCHGSRILIRLDGITYHEFTNFLSLEIPRLTAGMMARARMFLRAQCGPERQPHMLWVSITARRS